MVRLINDIRIEVDYKDSSLEEPETSLAGYAEIRKIKKKDPWCTTGGSSSEEFHCQGQCKAAHTTPWERKCAMVNDPWDGTRPDYPCKGCSECQDSPTCLAILYGNADFTGWSFAYGVGRYEKKDLGSKNDQASAMRVLGLASCKVTVYQHTKFEGRSATFGPGYYSSSTFATTKGFKFDNTVSSLKVTTTTTTPTTGKGKKEKKAKKEKEGKEEKEKKKQDKDAEKENACGCDKYHKGASSNDMGFCIKKKKGKQECSPPVYGSCSPHEEYCDAYS